MTHAGLAATLLAVIPGIEELRPLIETPLRDIPWGDWRQLWLGTLTQGRNAVLYFLPLLLVLRITPARWLQHAIVLTGLVFVAYVFGAFYLLMWVLSCVMFFALGEWYGGRAAAWGRKDARLTWAGIGIVAGHFLLVEGLGQIRLPAEWNLWMVAHAGWLLPLGARGAWWEPAWVRAEHLQIFKVLLGRSHDVGAAYLTMRLLSYFAELRRGSIPGAQRSLLRFMAYLCYVPLLIQGPIERYAPFHQQLETCATRRTFALTLGGGWRVLLGLGKCFFCAVLFYPLLHELQLGVFVNPVMYRTPEEIESYALLFFGVHLQVAYLYLVFSGYCDIAIGFSWLLGIVPIENFRRPWMARSLTDMWRRWHISLSFILRDYIYFPLTKRRWNNTLNLLVTFWICGIWHNFSGQYAAWGALMGLLVAVNQKWARWMRDLDRHPERTASRVRRAWLKLQPLPKLCAWFVTINGFLMTGWICFGGWGAFLVVKELIRRPLMWLMGS